VGMAGNDKPHPFITLAGIVLISLALCADAVIGNVQEKILKQFAASNSEMVRQSKYVRMFMD